MKPSMCGGDLHIPLRGSTIRDAASCGLSLRALSAKEVGTTIVPKLVEITCDSCRCSWLRSLKGIVGRNGRRVGAVWRKCKNGCNADKLAKHTKVSGRT